jgi:hypothetical protein
MPLALIHLLEGSLGGGEYPGNELPGRPPRPHPPGNATLPVLPGIWPRPGEPNLPVNLPSDPGGHPGNPIVIPEPPDKPLPPVGIYPPLPPTASGKVAVLVWVVGVGYRWAVIEGSIDNTLPPAPQPK